jgi:hypothetical protein
MTDKNSKFPKIENITDITIAKQNDVISEMIDYIENKEYNYLNKELLDFANDVQSKLKSMIK